MLVASKSAEVIELSPKESATSPLAVLSCERPEVAVPVCAACKNASLLPKLVTMPAKVALEYTNAIKLFSQDEYI